MSIFDDLFAPSSVKTTTEVDPYANMPSWQKDYYKGDVARTEHMLSDADKIAANLAKNPEQISGLSEQEKAANAGLQYQADGSIKNINKGISGLGEAYGEADQMLGAASAGVGGALDTANGQMETAGQYGQDWDTYEQQLAAAGDFDAIRGTYEDPYLNDVVDTTLAGMDYQAQVEQANRAAQESAVGGISSTRAAVADATAEALNGMNRAQMEASLRSEGFNTAAQFGLDQSAQMESLAQTGFSEQDAESRLGMDLATTGFGLQDDYSRLMADLAAAEAGLGSDYLADQIAGGNAQMGIEQTAAQWGATTGEQARLLKDAQAEAKRTAKQDATTWNSQIFNTTRGVQAPVGTTQTSTAPGPSPFNQVVGAATTAAGVWAGL
jgi:hypothetical protein